MQSLTARCRPEPKALRRTLAYRRSVPDPIFADPRLAQLYDDFDGERDDLDHYVAIVGEFHARSVLDVGCGTGSFASRLAVKGIEVVGVDPAAASLAVATTKPGADCVRWIHGDATTLPAMQVDMATMAGNVAQVFLDDSEWQRTLSGIERALRPSGHLVFEVRDPARRAWTEWNRAESYVRKTIAGVGAVEAWVDVTEVALPYVSFRHTYRFASDGAVLISNSTLRFRSRDEIETSLTATGFSVVDVRDAPDRPQREFVFIARTSPSPVARS